MKLERVEIAGRRHYITPIGNLPSVTTVLKETQSERDRSGLAFWRRKVGNAEADRVQVDSAARGSRLHTMIETYLKDGTEGSGPWWQSVASVVRSVDATRRAENPDTQLIQRAAIVVAYEDGPADVFDLDAAQLKSAWKEFRGRLGSYQVRFGKVVK